MHNEKPDKNRAFLFYLFLVFLYINIKKMKLFGYTFTLNEEHMIKYVLPYFDRIGYDKLVVYDSGSTDKTVEILSKLPYIEIRKITCEDGRFDFVKMNKQWESFYECKKYSEEHDGETVWMTFTDFDEVIFATNGSFETTKDMLCFREEQEGMNFSYFCERMPYLFYEGNCYDWNGPIHYDVKNIRCSDWYYSGSKVTMIKVNNFDLEQIVVGNHAMTVRKIKDIETLNLFDTGLFYGFHLKFIDKNLLIQQYKKNYDSIYKHWKTDKDDFVLRKSLDMYNEIYSISYSLSQYFAVRGLCVNDNDGTMKSCYGYSFGGLKIV